METGVWIHKMLSFLLVPASAQGFPSLSSPFLLTQHLFLVLIFLGILLLPLVLQGTRLKTNIILFLFLVAFSPAVVALFHLELLYRSVEEFFALASLMVLLFAVSTGMEFRLEFEGRPGNNTVYLLMGALVANLAGEITATLLMIRPFLQANERRKKRAHIPVFFILIVSNGAALLSPVAGTHLYLGVLRGIPLEFFPTLFPVWLFVTGALLSVFFLTDTLFARTETRVPSRRSRLPERLRKAIRTRQVPQSLLEELQYNLDNPSCLLEGVANLLFLAAAWGVLYSFSSFETPFPFREVSLLGISFLMFVLLKTRNKKGTGGDLRGLLEWTIFSYVVFLVLTPVIPLIPGFLQMYLPGDREHLFWLAGGLSAFLDPLPTALILMEPTVLSDTTYETLIRDPLHHAILKDLVAYGGPSRNLQAVLTSISLMGGATLTGNVMNLYVWKVSRGLEFPFPGYFRYILYSSLVLVPVFWLTGWLFFW